MPPSMSSWIRLRRTPMNSKTVTKVAVFGSRFTVDGTLYQVRANVSKVKREHDTEFELSISSNRAPTGLKRPSRHIKPVALLIDAASELFGTIDVRCDAMFEYDSASGHQSALPLPMRLLAPEAPDGVTHLENAEFSRRDDTGVRYSIVVLNTDNSGLLVHAVHFEQSTELSRGLVRQLLDRAHAISDRLLVPAGEN